MMKELKKKVESDIAFELNKANRMYPLFASRHEGMAVIAEETFEANQEMEKLKNAFNIFRYDVFTDEYESIADDVASIKEIATNLACEAIQVAAMCEKWGLGKPDERIE